MAFSPTRLDLFRLLGNGNFAWPLAIAERGRAGRQRSFQSDAATYWTN
jgi:hypothetical protein